MYYEENSISLWRVSLLPTISIVLSLLYTVFAVLFVMAAIVNIIRKKDEDRLLDEREWSKIMKYRVMCNVTIGYIPIVVYFMNIMIGK